MASTPTKLSIEQFFRDYGDVDGRHELVDGEVVARTGASIVQACVARNIVTLLCNKLHGSGCSPFNSQMGLRTGPATVRYPDAAIYCDRRDLERDHEEQLLEFPKVVFEVLSPSAIIIDRDLRLLEYKALGSVQTIVVVDPIGQSIDVHQRIGPRDWHEVTVARMADFVLDDTAITISLSEFFADE